MCRRDHTQPVVMMDSWNTAPLPPPWKLFAKSAIGSPSGRVPIATSASIVRRPSRATPVEWMT